MEIYFLNLHLKDLYTDVRMLGYKDKSSDSSFKTNFSFSDISKLLVL